MRTPPAVVRAVACLSFVISLACAAPAATATVLRSPQVPFVVADLQRYLDRIDGGIDVATDQIDNASWTAVLGNGCYFSCILDTFQTTAGFTVGLYSTAAATPTLVPLLPAGSRRGSSALCRLHSDGTLIVVLLDEASVFVSSSRYDGYDAHHIGFYLQGPAGTWYSEDARNGGRAQILSFLGTGVDYGGTFLCFETQPYDPNQSAFMSEVMYIQLRCGDPASSSTWGRVKTTYH